MAQEKIHAIDEFIRRLIKRYEAAEKKWFEFKNNRGLTSAELKTIYTIGDGSPKTMSMLAADLGVAVNTPVTAVERLISKNYVERFRGSEDKRQVLVDLTNDGRQIFEEIKKRNLEITENIISSLEESEITSFKDILDKLNQNLKSNR
ncbi:MAG: MarR family transcriptional regulator [Clostridia bacterium]|nr:MarR family transcriptional regulator [Clostridia bacterium]